MTSQSACPYCEGEGCSECDGTGERYATYVNAGDGLSAIVHGNAPLDDEAADAIVSVMRAAYDLMTKESQTMTRAQAIERMRQIAEEQKRLADELVSLYGLIEGGTH